MSINSKLTRAEALNIVKQRGFELVNMSAELRNDEEVVLCALGSCSYAFRFASDALKNSRKFTLSAVELCGVALEDIDEEFRRDREIVMCAIKKGGIFFINYERWHTDREIILCAIERLSFEIKTVNGGYACGYEDDCGYEDEEECPKYYLETILRNAGKTLQGDKEIIMCAINCDSFMLEHASAELKNDREVVMCAVSQNMWSLKYASKEMQQDGAIIKAVIDALIK